ncbi:MAG: ABC transporter permease, partial [Bryobacterales bacterium]|nr:ABC transporter permease [Bryobacterales bacterium]
AASLTQSEPFSMFSGEAMQFKVGMSGQGENAPLILRTRSERVGDGFFGTLNLPVLEGREFSRDDVENKRPVVIVNQTLAHEVWPKESAIGKIFEMDGVRQEVVGVSKDVRSGFAFEMAKKAAYRPMEPERFAKPSPEGVVLVVRTRPGVDAADVVRREVAALDPNLTLFRVRPMSDSVRQLRYLVEMTMYIYGGIGLFGLLLSAIGLAGVTAYSVTQRTREIGIRVALGATPGRVIRLVMREGAWLVAAGTVVGGAAAYGISKVLAAHLAATSQIMETSVSDPLLVAGAPALLAALALVACYLPARRSTRIDPMAALREQ